MLVSLRHYLGRRPRYLAGGWTSSRIKRSGRWPPPAAASRGIGAGRGFERRCRRGSFGRGGRHRRRPRRRSGWRPAPARSRRPIGSRRSRAPRLVVRRRGAPARRFRPGGASSGRARRRRVHASVVCLLPVWIAGRPAASLEVMRTGDAFDLEELTLARVAAAQLSLALVAFAGNGSDPAHASPEHALGIAGEALAAGHDGHALPTRSRTSPQRRPAPRRHSSGA